MIGQMKVETSSLSALINVCHFRAYLMNTKLRSLSLTPSPSQWDNCMGSLTQSHMNGVMGSLLSVTVNLQCQPI